MPGELASRLKPAVAEAVRAAGFDLDSLEVQPAGRRKLVKVVVDGEDGIGLDQVAEVSRTVAGVLDAHEHLIEGAYTLEVTSPGVERPLTMPRHWRRAKYRMVRITPHEGPDFVGRAGHAGPSCARVLVNGAIREVGYHDVAKAVIEVEFKQPPAEDLRALDDDARAVAGAAEPESKEQSK